jgi:hypothetical protein
MTNALPTAQAARPWLRSLGRVARQRHPRKSASRTTDNTDGTDEDGRAWDLPIVLADPASDLKE